MFSDEKSTVIFPYYKELQRVWDFTLAKNSACYRFMETGRKQETPELETRNFISHGTENSMSTSMYACVPLAPKSYEDNGNGPKWIAS